MNFWRHSKMPYPQQQLNTTASPHTPKHAGAAKLAHPFHQVLKLKCTSSSWCPNVQFFAVVVTLHGQPSNMSAPTVHHMQHKIMPQTNVPRKSCPSGPGVRNLDSSTPIAIFNDNQGCVDWCKTATTTGMKHLNLCENAVRENILDCTLTIHHFPGKSNCSDIIIKELKDTSHFCIILNQTMFLLGTKSTLDTTVTHSPPTGCIQCYSLCT